MLSGFSYWHANISTVIQAKSLNVLPQKTPASKTERKTKQYSEIQVIVATEFCQRSEYHFPPKDINEFKKIKLVLEVS